MFYLESTGLFSSKVTIFKTTIRVANCLDPNQAKHFVAY